MSGNAADGQVFHWPVTVYWEDTDASGVVYHANYLRWMERARTEWLRAQGFEQAALAEQLGIGFTISDLQMRFIKPARLDDTLQVQVEVARQRRVSLEFVQRVVKNDSEALLATARVAVACVRLRDFRPAKLPLLAKK